MKPKLELGELEFKAEDFIKYNSLQHDGKGTVNYPSILADAVNRILRDKLEKAPLLSGHYGNIEWHVIRSCEEYMKKIYSTARLVCIEEIEEKKE